MFDEPNSISQLVTSTNVLATHLVRLVRDAGTLGVSSGSQGNLRLAPRAVQQESPNTSTTHSTGVVSLTTPSLIAIIILAVVLGFALTIAIQRLGGHVLYRSKLHSRGDAEGNTVLGASQQTQDRWQRHSGDIDENHFTTSSPRMVDADRKSRSNEDFFPGNQGQGTEEDGLHAIHEPPNSARSAKPSTTHTSASSDFRPLRHDTVQDLKVQPSAFHRWSIESAEALRKSRNTLRVKRQNFQNTWVSNKSGGAPVDMHDPEKDWPGVYATSRDDSTASSTIPLSNPAGEDGQVKTPRGLRPGSYYRPWRSSSSSLLQVTNHGSEDRAETPPSSHTSQCDDLPGTFASSGPELTRVNLGHAQMATPEIFHSSSYYPSLASTPDFGSEPLSAAIVTAVVDASRRDETQRATKLQIVSYAASPGSSPGLHLEQVAGGDEAARIYRCWDETIRLSDYK